jgi:hypothetical protein
MTWTVRFDFDFEADLAALQEEVRLELLAHLRVLQQFGPQLGRPLVDTLVGSKHANMKELRFKSEGGVWRFAFAFDVRKRAVVLCGGDKGSANEKRFYRDLIRIADKRFDAYLKRTEKENADPKRSNKKSTRKTARSRKR